MVPFLTPYRTRVFIIAVLALSLLSSTAFASQLDSKRSELKNVKAKIEATKKAQQTADRKKADVLKEIQANDRIINKLQKEIADLKKDIKSISTNRHRTEAELAAMQARLQKTQQELSIAERQLAYKREIYNKRLKGIYKGGKKSIIELVLNARNFGDLLERSALIAKIAENDARLVADMKQTRQGILKNLDQIADQKRVIGKKRLVLVDEENHLHAVKNRVAGRQDLFNRERKRQQQILARVQRNKTQLAKAEDLLMSTSNDIASQIRALERGGRIAVSRGYRASGGGLMWPVSAPITSGFGWRMHPVLGYARFHSGVDLGAPYGTTVGAAQGGTVIMAGWYGGYGNAVIIDHGGGISTLYGHNSSLLVGVGQVVAKGQGIAISGSTGLSTGPHVHFEVRQNGNPVDPLGYLN
ncbi:MAG TPA: peptidoglycan DD-metalloendopeptidase family protein [Candidatus Aquicultor sp.]|jgi:murein DD-endopeptidase MepM/ murein hydrolase activator NlpD